MSRRLSVTAIVFLLLLSLIFHNGCSSGDTSHIQSVSYNLGIEPYNIDPAMCTSVEEGNVVLACFEGLMRLDRDGKAIPGIAASYKKDSDIKYTFRLRDAKWSDGVPVTARDFEYAWKRVLSPETGCENAYQLFTLKGGEAFNKGEAGAETVGVRALDSKTLEVQLEAPVFYFPELLTLPQYMPAREDIVNKNPSKWARVPSSYIGDGPFRLSSWEHGYSIELEKNNTYYDAERIKLGRLVFKMIFDPVSYIAQFENGSIDIIESPPDVDISMLENWGKIIKSPYAGVYFYSFNTNVKPLNDKRVRKALAYSVDRLSLIQNVIGNGAAPAMMLVPRFLCETSDVKDENFKPRDQLKEARELLKEAGYAGGKGFPKITLVYDNTGSHGRIASAIQSMWENNLNITIALKSVSLTELQKLRSAGDFDIIRQCWAADYADPAAFLDLYTSDGGCNYTRYSNSSYDALVASIKLETDHAKRSALIQNTEEMLMEDMPMLPLYYYNNILCVRNTVNDVIKLPIGFTLFDQAYLAQ